MYQIILLTVMVLFCLSSCSMGTCCENSTMYGKMSGGVEHTVTK